ncbi:MAG: hypothetical protein EA365_01155 [Gloeocapsa sp. DLM2.Bin57]|nr:MAG: hypothetical protein EA365_01155 [Gloeocapsa sp. DLM2.Bin57]
MQLTETLWSEAEKQTADSAFQLAYSRETNALIEQIRRQASSLTAVDDLWSLHDYLSARRHELDGKYDNRYPTLIFVFAQLLKEGWLSVEDLQGLSNEKLTKISALAKM